MYFKNYSGVKIRPETKICDRFLVSSQKVHILLVKKNFTKRPVISAVHKRSKSKIFKKNALKLHFTSFFKKAKFSRKQKFLAEFWSWTKQYYRLKNFFPKRPKFQSFGQVQSQKILHFLLKKCEFCPFLANFSISRPEHGRLILYQFPKIYSFKTSTKNFLSIIGQFLLAKTHCFLYEFP